MSYFGDLVAGQAHRMAMPILTYPGASLINASVRDLVTSAQSQVEAQMALQARFQTSVVLSAMDLSAEAEAFGCQIVMGDNDPPTVTGRLVTTQEAASALRVPEPGEARTSVCLETVRKLKKLPSHPFVVGGLIGPFSLAGRLYGVSEIMALTIQNPALTHLLVEKSASFLAAYARAFKAAGADAVVMAEPTAGLISPRAMAAFSSQYIKQVVAAVDDGSFTLILHNCAARAAHLEAVLASGAKAVHFGAPMDMLAALRKVDPQIVVCGNLDPSQVLVQSSPQEVATAVRSLLEDLRPYPNFVLSSGCDVPSRTPIENLDAFFDAAGYARRSSVQGSAVFE